MNIFDLEQEIMHCWNVVDDVRDAADYIASCEYLTPASDDKTQNLLLGIHALYQMRFEKLWAKFEAVAGDYHSLRQQIEQDHDYNEQV